MSMMYTTASEMRNIKSGDLFLVNGEVHRAIGNAHISGDASCEEFLVFDENGEGWFETDFFEHILKDNRGDELLKKRVL